MESYAGGLPPPPARPEGADPVRDIEPQAVDWDDPSRTWRGPGSPAGDAAPVAPQGSLLSGRLPTGEVCGHVTYRGSGHGDAIVVGLFDATQAGTPLEYWVELDGPGPYVLDGIKPGRYELHACLTSSVSANGLPRDVLATGQWSRGSTVSGAAGDVLDAIDIELVDEVPSRMLQGVDTVFFDVNDLEASVRFYRDVLGLPLTLKERSWAEFDTGTCLLALRRRPESHVAVRRGNVRRGLETTGAMVVFRVGNLDDVRRELLHRGVKFIGRVIEIPEARWTTFHDLDGNRMQLFERKT
jgi:lactoylglutathione lyase